MALYVGMPVMVHFSYERFSPEYSRVAVLTENLVTIESPSGSRRVFRRDTGALDGDFGYTAYFNTLAQELREALLDVDEAEEGLRRFRLARAAA